MTKIVKFLTLAFATVALSACAGISGGSYIGDGKDAPDLVFQKETVTVDWASNFKNIVVTPNTIEPNKKYPAVVLLPSCAGYTVLNEATFNKWARILVNNGYVVVSVDHLNPRKAGTNCKGAQYRTVSEARMVKDAYDAVQHLAKLPFVDSNKIFMLGFSLGANTASQSASRAIYESIAKGQVRPRAVAGVYGGCVFGQPRYNFQYMFTDTDIPLLWLMGENDTETPPSSCTWLLKSVKEKNPETEFELYPNAGHCWDCEYMDGFRKIAANGNAVEYKFNAEVTRKSEKRVVDFFNKFK